MFTIGTRMSKTKVRTFKIKKKTYNEECINVARKTKTCNFKPISLSQSF